VSKAELERYNRNKDDSLSIENSRNNRIKMEDPFMRKTDEKHIFPSMNETDISKFIIG